MLIRKTAREIENGDLVYLPGWLTKESHLVLGVSKIGTTSENFNDNINRTRPVASVGAYYAATKTQRVAGGIYYQELPFQRTGSTTAYLNYMIDF